MERGQGGPARRVVSAQASGLEPREARVYPRDAALARRSLLESAEGRPAPCTITISVNGADVGAAAASSLLEEVGSYAFGAARPQAAITNAQAEIDELALEVDGICCFNAR